MTRYHPLLVALHWLLALMIIAALLAGTFLLAPVPNDDPAKLGALQAHMSIGVAILVLMAVRLATRVGSTKPPEADIGNPALNRLGAATHWLFYLLVFGMVASGISMSLAAGLPDIVFGRSGAPLPESFDGLAPRVAHGLIATALMLLIAAHVGAAFYHQLVRKDRLLSRMWFGNRQG